MRGVKQTPANDQSFPSLAFSSRHDLGGGALEDRGSGLELDARGYRPPMASRATERTRTFPSEFASVPLVRDFVRASLRRPPAVPPEVVSDVELAVSELATNGVRHGSGDPVTVDLDRDSATVTVLVTSTLAAGADNDPATWERVRPTGPVGRGIGIVKAISSGLTYQVTGRSVSASCRFPITV